MFRRLILRTILLIAVAAPALSIADDPRTWTDSSGAHKIEASFVSSADGIVTLRTPEGNLLRVPEERLCADDKALVAKILRVPAVPAPDAADQAVADRITSHAELVVEIDRKRRAREVVSLYEGFLRGPTLSHQDRAAAEKELARWRELAAQNSVRYGGDWRTESEIQKLQEEAQILIDQAFRHIEVGNDALARETLLKASKSDPEGVRADFALGLLHALVGGHPEDARKHFLVCIRRLDGIGEYRTSMQTANLVAAMNNTAIAEVRLKSNSSALKRWRTVVGAGKVPPELIQNLGRYSDLAAANEFVRVSVATVKSIGEVYARAAGENASRPYDASVGWLYIPHLSRSEKDGKARDAAQPDNQNTPRAPEAVELGVLRVCGSGTGFAIGPDLIVTNRHVADGAQGLAIHRDGAKLAEFSGEVVALCNDADLALLRFNGLGASPLPLADELPRLSASVRVLGYPESQLLGNTLKATAGSVAGLPSTNAGGDAELSQMLLLDAIANPGNSGGPVVEVSGKVVGVLTLQIKLDQEYTAAVPVTVVRNFLTTNGVELDGIAAQLMDGERENADAEWEDVVAQAAPSTFQILVMGLPDRTAWAGRNNAPDNQDRPKAPAEWNGLEDRWCMHCQGLSHVDCPNRPCRGGVLVFREQRFSKLPDGSRASYWVTTQSDCGTCGGDGRIPCPYCSNGFDPRLR